MKVHVDYLNFVKMSSVSALTPVVTEAATEGALLKIFLLHY